MFLNDIKFIIVTSVFVFVFTLIGLPVTLLIGGFMQQAALAGNIVMTIILFALIPTSLVAIAMIIFLIMDRFIL